MSSPESVGDRGTCDSCGSDDEALQAVQRVYLVPEPATVDEVERWCPSCVSQYPHQAVSP